MHCNYAILIEPVNEETNKIIHRDNHIKLNSTVLQSNNLQHTSNVLIPGWLLIDVGDEILQPTLSPTSQEVKQNRVILFQYGFLVLNIFNRTRIIDKPQLSQFKT